MEKRFLRLPALILLPVYTVFAALTALQAVLNTDAVWQNSLWTDVIEVALHWLEIGGFCVILAFFGAGIYRFTAKKCLPLYLLAVGALVYKYALSVAALSVAFGAFDLTYNWIGYLVSFLIELLIAAFFAWFAHGTFARAAEKEKRRAAAAARLGSPAQARAYVPFARLFSKDNPLSRALLCGVAALAAFRLAVFFADDIAFTVQGYAYTAADIPVTILYLFLWILLPAFLGYLLTLVCAAHGLGAKKTFAKQ